jgi:NAD(P)-dependent dehydrogenase (short-subunit alcohol dehydrogenase family)
MAGKRALPEELQFLVSRGAPQKTSAESMEGKVCVVTGSSSGVGLEATRRLAEGGALVVMVCRDRAKAEPIRAAIAAAGGIPPDIVVADFFDLAQVRAAASEVISRHPRIDALINSAGLHSTRRRLTKDSCSRSGNSPIASKAGASPSTRCTPATCGPA